MSKEKSNETLLDLKTVVQPFNLSQALKYMNENGEFIRCKNDTQDFYMYLDVQKRPAIVNGKRQFVEIETVWAFNQWGGTPTTIGISDLFKNEFYIMSFNDQGEPVWTDPNGLENSEVM